MAMYIHIQPCTCIYTIHTCSGQWFVNNEIHLDWLIWIGIDNVWHPDWFLNQRNEIHKLAWCFLLSFEVVVIVCLCHPWKLALWCSSFNIDRAARVKPLRVYSLDFRFQLENRDLATQKGVKDELIYWNVTRFASSNWMSKI